MDVIRKNVRELLADTRGVTAVEYGIIAALMSVALVTAVGFLTGGLTTAFTNIGNTLTGTG